MRARLVGCLLLPCGLLSAQATGPTVLNLPGGARAGSLGNAFVAGRGPEVLFYNPAQLSLAPGLLVSAARYGSASTQVTSATTMTVGQLTAGFGVQYLDYRPSAFPSHPGEIGEPGFFIGASLAATAAVSFRWKGLRWGAAAKYVQEHGAGILSGHGALDVGVGREWNRLTFGLSAQHIGSDLPFGDGTVALPRRMTLGAALPRLPIGTYFDIGATAALAWERGGRFAPAGGVELFYQPVEGWLFALRAGARLPEDAPRPKLHPVTLGAGVSLDRLALDYGFEKISGGGTVHRLGLRIQ